MSDVSDTHRRRLSWPSSTHWHASDQNIQNITTKSNTREIVEVYVATSSQCYLWGWRYACVTARSKANIGTTHTCALCQSVNIFSRESSAVHWNSLVCPLRWKAVTAVHFQAESEGHVCQLTVMNASKPSCILGGNRLHRRVSNSGKSYKFLE